MAKVQIKSEKITPFGGIFQVRELFSRFVGPVIGKVLGLRCTSFCYQYGEIVEFYNLRGGKERIFDDMNNGFGWARLPKSFMAENTVFLLLTAIIRRSAMPLAIARTSTSSSWADWTQKPSD